MLASSIPTKLPIPFANAGTKNAIPSASQIAITPGAASLTDGFPPLTMLPIASGGIPPFGSDFNGILFEVTAWAVWQAAGGTVGYDAAFSTAIGGYPKGAVLAASATVGAFWISTVDNNVTNPDTGGAGWIGAALFGGSSPVVGNARNLAGSAAGATVTASWTVDEIAVGTALGGSIYKGASLTLNFNGAGTGAGGMDIGAVPTSADLNIYAIYNPTTVTWSTLGTVTGHGTIYSGGHMPAGYTASALIWAGKTDGAAKIIGFTQVGGKIEIVAVTALSSGTATTFTSISLSTIIPAAALAVSGTIGVGVSTGDSTGNIAVISTDNAGRGSQGCGYQAGGSSGGGGSSTCAYVDLLVVTIQTIFYEFTFRNTGTVSVGVSAYRIF
jgi:hypothetical protein